MPGSELPKSDEANKSMPLTKHSLRTVGRPAKYPAGPEVHLMSQHRAKSDHALREQRQKRSSSSDTAVLVTRGVAGVEL